MAKDLTSSNFGGNHHLPVRNSNGNGRVTYKGPAGKGTIVIPREHMGTGLKVLGIGLLCGYGMYTISKL